MITEETQIIINAVTDEEVRVCNVLQSTAFRVNKEYPISSLTKIQTITQSVLNVCCLNRDC